jgi:hypothetical protein
LILLIALGLSHKRDFFLLPASPPFARCLKSLNPRLNAKLLQAGGLSREVNSNFLSALQQKIIAMQHTSQLVENI